MGVVKHSLLALRHGRLARWRKWRACDVGEAKEGFENELWRRWSIGRVGEWAVTEGWENELWKNEHSSFSKLSVTSPTSQLILQPFRRFTNVTAHSPTLPLLYQRHSLFSNPSFASPTSQALHLRHLAAAHVAQWCPESLKERRVAFPLSTFCVSQSTLPLSKSRFCTELVVCLCVSYDNRHRITCLLPWLTTVLFCFDYTRRSYCGSWRRRKIGGKGNIHWLRHRLQRDEFGHRGPNIIRIQKSKRLRWTGHVAHMEKSRNA